jgi:diacylglycerol O-acyltransferase / wax synthase
MNDTARPMSRVDTAWLRMDTEVNLMMIVGVWLLKPAVRYQDLCDRVSERLLKYDRFRQKVVQGVLGSQWVVDEAFDVRRHVTIEKLPRRRGQSERAALKQRMGELASTPLDHAHPLWQFHFVEHYEGGSASICRIHHCVADGIALTSVMMSITDDAGLPPEIDRAGADPEQLHQGDWVTEELLKPITDAAVSVIDLSGDGLAKALQAIGHPRQSADHLLELLRDGRRLVSDAAALALMPNDSPTALKGHGSGRKIVDWCEPLPLEEVKAVGKALGASVNDVLLSCVAGAIGRYLRDVGDDPTAKDIRAMVPVNLRPLEQAWQLGNRFGLAPLLVPVGIDNPLQRLQVVRARMSAHKLGFQPLLAYGILNVSGLLNTWAQQQLSSLFLDKTTAVMTNVPGPPVPLRLCGSTVRQNIAWVPSSGDIGVGVSIISYAGGVQFGLVTDAKLCPEPGRIIDRFADEFEQLLLLALMLPWRRDEASSGPQRRARAAGG